MSDSLRFELSVVRESVEDQAAIAEAVDYAAHIYRSQLDIELVVSYSDVSEVASHTKAQTLLDEVNLYRLDHAPHRAADATVLFTHRTMTEGFEAIATIGPACSASASTVVTLRSDGYDGQILAHELLHTIGVPHDSASGYLMSENLSRAGNDYMSPDTVATVKAAELAECMGVLEQVPDGKSGGGGGSFDGLLLVAAFISIWFFGRRSK